MHDEQGHPREIVAVMVLRHFLLAKGAWPVVHMPSEAHPMAKLIFVSEVDKMHARAVSVSGIYLICTFEVYSDKNYTGMAVNSDPPPHDSAKFPSSIESAEASGPTVFTCGPSKSPRISLWIQVDRHVYPFESLVRDIEIVVEALYACL